MRGHVIWAAAIAIFMAGCTSTPQVPRFTQLEPTASDNNKLLAEYRQSYAYLSAIDNSDAIYLADRYESFVTEYSVQLPSDPNGFIARAKMKSTELRKMALEQYRNEYSNATAIDSLERFVAKYSEKKFDPDNVIEKASSKLAELKEIEERRKRKQYGDDYLEARTIVQLGSFIEKYKNYDPDQLVPKAREQIEKLKRAEYLFDFKSAKTRSDFNSFIEKYSNRFDPDRLTEKAKDKIIDLWRKEKTFNGFYEAFKLTSSKDDFNSMQRYAKTKGDKSQLENLALSLVPDKNAIFDVLLGCAGSPESVMNMGRLFVPQAKESKTDYTCNTSISLAKKSPIKLSYGTYTVTVKFALKMKYRTVRRSWVLGNADNTWDDVTERIVTYTVFPPKYKASNKVSFGEKLLSYADRGAAGGSTVTNLVSNPETERFILNIKQN